MLSALLQEDERLKVLGAVIPVPTDCALEDFAAEDIQHCLRELSERFSEGGRQRFARELCENLDKYGWSIPLGQSPDDEVDFLCDEDCQDTIIDCDYQDYPSELVESTIEMLEDILKPKESPELRREESPGM